MAAAGRRKVSNAAAVAMAVALVALLVAAGEAGQCGVDQGQVTDCVSYCRGGAMGRCCDALRGADFGCVCDKYGGILKSKYADCVGRIKSGCGIHASC